MAHHEWGDGFDFDKLDRAGIFISRSLRILLRIRLMWKEKYGTIRYEHFTGAGSVRGLTPIKRRVFEVILFVACIRFYSHRSEILNDILADYKGTPWFARLFIKENPWKSL